MTKPLNRLLHLLKKGDIMLTAAGVTLLTFTLWQATPKGIKKIDPVPPAQFQLGDLTDNVHINFDIWLRGKEGKATILMDSIGGQIEIGRQLMSSVRSWKKEKKDRKLQCNVLQAMSMAFVFLTQSCDKVYFLPSSQLMWHAPYKKVNEAETISYEEAKQLTVDLKRLNAEMLRWIGPTFRNSDLDLVAISYLKSQVWTAIPFLNVLHPFPMDKFNLVNTFSELED